MQRRYVYYRVAADQVAEATAAWQAVANDWLAQHPQTRLELLRRPEVKDGLATLMEIQYGAGADADALEQRFAAALAPWLRSPRHIEHFEPLA